VDSGNLKRGKGERGKGKGERGIKRSFKISLA
jgi:hypothetical protein